MTTNHRPPPNAETRFSDRVDDYVKYRPSYPREVIDLLAGTCGIGPETVVADIGAGTGIFSRLLHGTDATVHAIEPNNDMRAALIAASTHETNLHAHGSSAEATGLDDKSIDLITAAQAFHWFNRRAARQEFARILRPDGWVALIWNTRRGRPGQF